MNNKKKIKSISFKVVLAFVFLAIIFGATIVWFSSNILQGTFLVEEGDKLKQMVVFAASTIDGDKIVEYYETGKTDEEYDRMLADLSSLKESTNNVAFLFVAVPEEDHLIYIADALRETDNVAYHSEFLERYDYTDIEYSYIPQLVESGEVMDEPIYGPVSELYGNRHSIIIAAPVKDSTGKVVAMVEADSSPERIYENERAFIYFISILILIGMIILIFIVYLMIKIMVIKPLVALDGYVESYHDGKYEGKRPSVSEHDEIGTLLNSFEQMGIRVDEYLEKITKITAEREKLGAELSVATRIQESVLPRIFPPFPERDEFDLYASMKPAKEVGGDFYDFYMIDDDHLVLTIADVSGKGVPGALFMMVSKMLLKNQVSISGASPAEVFNVVNNQLCENNEAEMFVTVWLGILEISTGKLVASSAGHEFPAIRRKGGEFEILKDRHGFVLGGMEGMKFKEYELQLNPGDAIFVYTDGVAEATDAKDELFGTTRMIDALNIDSAAISQKLIENVHTSIEDFVQEAPQFDDITMLCLDYKGPDKA